MSSSDALFLFDEEMIGPEAVILRRFAVPLAAELIRKIQDVATASPFRHMTTSRGFRMSVAMTNCGSAGWVSDRKGYRYERVDPETGSPWPAMPPMFFDLAQRAAARIGVATFSPDVCLINRYGLRSQLSLHQDRDETSFDAPIVSVSLGLPARFLFGGLTRQERARRYELCSGDVVVWGGASRLAFHGIAPLADGNHPLTGPYRFNLTFRSAL